jgi:hypothetical protein
MACPVPDGACIAPKTEDGLAPLIVFRLTGYDNKVSVEWETDVSHPGQTVKCVYRVKGGVSTDRVIVPRNDGILETPEVFSVNDIVYLYLRVEDATNFSEWILYKALAINGWVDSFQQVTFDGEIVTFNGEFVTI